MHYFFMHYIHALHAFFVDAHQINIYYYYVLLLLVLLLLYILFLNSTTLYFQKARLTCALRFSKDTLLGFYYPSAGVGNIGPLAPTLK